jgi:cation transport regulator ChaC
VTLYFAYGSNMDPRQMARRCKGAPALGRAVLRDRRLSFTGDSKRWRGGVGTVLPVAGEEVWGVLWELAERHGRRLDRYELVRKGIYTKERLTVEHDGRPVQALVYVAAAAAWRAPSRKYLGRLIEGARHFGLPVAYVAGLQAHSRV